MGIGCAVRANSRGRSAWLCSAWQADTWMHRLLRCFPPALVIPALLNRRGSGQDSAEIVNLRESDMETALASMDAFVGAQAQTEAGRRPSVAAECLGAVFDAVYTQGDEAAAVGQAGVVDAGAGSSGAAASDAAPGEHPSWKRSILTEI
jgi:hypothetical protein